MLEFGMNTPRTVDTDLVSFTWQVPEDGFRIVETIALSRHGAGATPPGYPLDIISAPPRQDLVEEGPLGDGHELKTYITHGSDDRLELWIHNFGRDSAGENYEYDVFQDTPRLYETLADTPATPEGVLEFANKYGVLETRGAVRIRGYNEQGRSAAYPAQPVDIWFERIEQMREVVTLWRMAKEGAFAQLRECFDHPLAGFMRYKGREVIVNPGLPERERLRMAALSFVALLCNEHLRDLVYWSLYPQEPGLPLRASLQPYDLIGALWLQASFDFTKTDAYKRCAYCGGHFRVKGFGARKKSRKYCSDKCRQAAHYYRHRVG